MLIQQKLYQFPVTYFLHDSQQECSLCESYPKKLYLRYEEYEPEYYGQKRSLVSLKKEREWYSDIHADVLQDMVKRVDLAFQRFIKGDSKGKRSGRPRFKGKNRYRTFAYQRVKPDCMQGNRITLPKFGDVKLILHRPIPEGFIIKRALVTKKADGFYVTLTLEDKSIPDAPSVEIHPTEANSIGVDAGLEVRIVG